MKHSTLLHKTSNGLHNWCRVSALDAVPRSLVLETQHSHRLETFLGRQVFATGIEALHRRESKTWHKRPDKIKTSTRYKQSVDQALRKTLDELSPGTICFTTPQWVFFNVLRLSLTLSNDDEDNFREVLANPNAKNLGHNDKSQKKT